MKFMQHGQNIGHQSLSVAECDVPLYDPEKEVLIKVEAAAVNKADLL